MIEEPGGRVAGQPRGDRDAGEEAGAGVPGGGNRDDHVPQEWRGNDRMTRVHTGANMGRIVSENF